METSSGNYWRESLSAWAIPDEIINNAPENPWIHPPVMFELPDVIEDSISHQRAREVLVSGDSVLDIDVAAELLLLQLSHQQHM
jgi:hypothetical protein